MQDQANASKPSSPNTDKYEWFWSAFDCYLCQNKLKQTNQRRVIINEFLSETGHVDAEEVHSKLRKAGHSIGLATIYRTLNMLKDAKLIEQHSFADGRAVFEIVHPDEHHDHLVCLSCQRIDEFENNEIEELQVMIANQHGYTLRSHRLELYGICPTCQKKQGTPQ